MVHAPEPADTVAVRLPDAWSIFQATAAGLLSWVVPGLGHIFLGDRARGLICMVAIVLTFWTGVAIGGVRGTIDPQERSLWFMAQLCSGANAGVAYAIRQNLPPPHQATVPSWVSAEIGVHYTGVAGLLNVLIILDAMARSDRGRAVRRLAGRNPGGGQPP